MKLARTLLCCCALLPGALLKTADTLDIYLVDVEGGKAEVIRTPSGQAVLIDGGFPGREGRDVQRIAAAAKAAGVTSFDYAITTHYDVDHAGNIPAVAAQIPIKVFVDHGPLIADPKMSPPNKNSGEAYLAFVAGKKRMSVTPGQIIPLKDVKVTILTANEKALAKPMPGAGKPNPACPATPPGPMMYEDNSGSVGELWEFGKFKMADFGDLLKWVENRLVCPNDPVGHVDLYVTNHHGVAMSNSPELLAALQPKVVIMNNGETKGDSVETMKTLHALSGLQDLWQLHFSTSVPAEMNPPENFIANLKAADDQAKWIKVSAKKDGSFTVTNDRNGFSKEYK